ncbi:SCO4402 family protein [Nakamurella panacisegetis]|uniref:SCO4402 family protein n=1 Tax=Nakamurella panacisegetis TaxID=1090615 RepID=UPI0012FE25C4|nr:hypothetical protein [Nakamurella panacisegetis]
MPEQEVAWTGRRLDVIAALDRLATINHANVSDWPDLTNAVHWLIDDTWWDHHPPEEEIGLILRDQTEAASISLVVEAVLVVLGDVPVGSPDRDCLDHPRWDDVASLAVASRDLMARPV